jgi:hypothetical protein
MFQINQYLQYKNTPDGKPRVLKLPSQYEVFTKDVETPSGYILTTKPIIKQLQHITYYDSEEGIVEVSLSDCRPLLSVELKNYSFSSVISDKILNLREMQVVHYLGRKAEDEDDYDRDECWGLATFREDQVLVYFGLNQSTWGSFSERLMNEKGFTEFRGCLASSLNYSDMAKRIELFNFEDDPAKHSKLLWNCSEEEGWKKVFKLLLSR